jgi:hypothetical protein
MRERPRCASFHVVSSTAKLLLFGLALAGVRTAAGAPFSKPLAHDAQFFPATQAHVRAGDLMRATVIRNDRTKPMTTTDAKWVSRIGWLNAVTKPGVHKALTFSSVEDVRSLLPSVPGDVNYIEYNMERGMTPESDFANMALSVETISKMVRASGRKFTFGPIHNTWNVLEKSGEFDAVVKNCDAVAVQMQRVWMASPTIDALQAAVRPLVKKFKAANPRVQVSIQLWLGRQTVPQMIEGFRAIEPEVDIAVIGTHSNQNGVLQVMQALTAGTDPKSGAPAKQQ